MKYIVVSLLIVITNSSKITQEQDYRLLQQFGILQDTERREDNVLNPNYRSNESVMKKFAEKATDYGKFGKEQAEKLTKSLKNAGNNVKEVTTDFMGKNTKSNLNTAKNYMKWGFCLCRLNYDDDEIRLTRAALHAEEILKLDRNTIAKFLAFRGDETKRFAESTGAYKKRRESEISTEQKQRELKNLIAVLNGGIIYMYVKACTKRKFLAEEQLNVLELHPHKERFSRQNTESMADILDAIQRVVDASGEEVIPLEKWKIEEKYQDLKCDAMNAAEYYNKPLNVVLHDYYEQAEDVMDEYLQYRQNLDEIEWDYTRYLVQEIKKISAPKVDGFFTCCKKGKRIENLRNAVVQDIVKRSATKPNVLFAFKENEDNVVIDFDRSHMIGYNAALCAQNEQSHGNIIDDSIFRYDYSEE